MFDFEGFFEFLYLFSLSLYFTVSVPGPLFELPVGVLIGSCQQVLVSHWSRTLFHRHLLIASRAPMCRVAILVSTETAAKDALLLTSAKSHPTQFCFSSRLQWTSRFYVEAQLDFRTLLFVPRRALVVLFELNQEPNSDFHQTAAICDAWRVFVTHLPLVGEFMVGFLHVFIAS